MAYYNQEMKQAIAPRIRELLKEYKVKGTLSVRNHSTIVLTLKSGAVDFGQNENKYNPGYLDVNVYYIDDRYNPTAKKFLRRALEIMMEGNWDNSDIQTDYFDKGWYVDINVGKWDKPYQMIA
jgi:hypothetical protein